MEWKTRVTELLGCRYPIIQGAEELLTRNGPLARILNSAYAWQQ